MSDPWLAGQLRRTGQNFVAYLTSKFNVGVTRDGGFEVCDCNTALASCHAQNYHWEGAAGKTSNMGGGCLGWPGKTSTVGDSGSDGRASRLKIGRSGIRILLPVVQTLHLLTYIHW